MKKLLVAVLVIALVALTGQPSFAGHHHHHHCDGVGAIALGVGVVAGAVVGALCSNDCHHHHHHYHGCVAPPVPVVVRPARTVVVYPAPVVVYRPVTVVRPACVPSRSISFSYYDY
ncbi:MAG TPA: hypothetical protein PLG17_08505 [Thermodesulfobacteriota bacterium]|nr:hypothetical protein [Deltaproteobacteria bacterium]HNR13285.1 hypothetical protein [Thermodesulfobacteriota bacterium]HNU72668.1 hypothetical protein [Thermodesulfobacteriota bacterium]HOC37992.1 hypothetical protein [Thermodesulfobacteriota bacterium]HQO78538.1 hypothetical protein [Thermodesulfobacteriota bacterium]